MAHDIKLVRTPIYVYSSDVDDLNCTVPTIGHAYCYIKIYTGDINNHTSEPVLYTLHKHIELVHTSRKVAFEISNYINDYIDINYNTHRNNQLWVYIEISTTDCYQSLLTNTQFLAIKGYGDYLEGVNPIISTTLNSVYFNRDSIYVTKPENAINFPINTDVVAKVEYADINGLILDAKSYSASNVSDEVIVYSTPSNIANISNAKSVHFMDSSNVVLRSIKIKDFCKGDITPNDYKITYLNKQGVFEYFYIFSTLIETISKTNSEFKTNKISTGYGDKVYDITKHSTYQYNINSITKFTVNTGFVNEEDYKLILEQLINSPVIWITKEGNTLPIRLLNKNFKYKTRVVDKLINYELNFEYDFDNVQNIK
jgi:hypothetical protein